MKRNFAIRLTKRFTTDNAGSIGKRALILSGAVAILAACSLFAQNAALQEKIASVKQSLAKNTQRLHAYEWTETTQLTLKGDPKPPSQSLCRYGPDGTVQKFPFAPPPEPPSGGRLKQRIIAKKKAEMKDYMGDVKGLLGVYVPPDPQRIQQAYQDGKVSFNPKGGYLDLVFRDYVKPGDQMTLSFDTTLRKVTFVTISTYMDEPKDAVTLRVQMSSLPNGINYVQQSVLNATEKKLLVTTTNSNYQKRGA